MTEVRFLQLVDVGEKLFIIVLAFPFLFAFGRALPVHPQVLLIALSESLAVFFILIRKPGTFAGSPLAVFVALGGTAFPLLARPSGDALLPSTVTASLMVIGLILSVASKLYLNRSFGVLPANRGIKSRGPYRLVRHPMYLGYILNQVGFLLSSFSLTNAAVYVLAWTCQLRRVHEEELQLSKDPVYRDFARKVSNRLIPGLY